MFVIDISCIHLKDIYGAFTATRCHSRVPASQIKRNGHVKQDFTKKPKRDWKCVTIRDYQTAGYQYQKLFVMYFKAKVMQNYINSRVENGQVIEHCYETSSEELTAS